MPARLIGSRVRVMLSANELHVFDGSALAAVHPRLIAAGDEHLELDHYLEILARKPGALPGSAALAQARAAGVFTSTHEAFWAAARARHGDAAGTKALIEVLLLHRRMPGSQVIAGMTAALAAGSCSPDVVAVEAASNPPGTRNRPPGRPGRRYGRGGPARRLSPCHAGRLSCRRTGARHRRWPPTTSCWHPPPGEEARDGPGRDTGRADRHCCQRRDRPGLPDPAAADHPEPARRGRRRGSPPAGQLQGLPGRAAVAGVR